MNMRFSPHFLCFLSFLSSVFYSLLCTSLLCPWLDLWLGVLLCFDDIINIIAFLISIVDCSLWVHRHRIGFVCLTSILQPNRITLFVLRLWIRSVLHTKRHIVCEQRWFYFLLSDLDVSMAFSCLIALDGVWNRGTEAAQCVLIQRRGFSSSHKVWCLHITTQHRSHQLAFRPWTWVPYPPCFVPLFLPAVLGPWKSGAWMLWPWACTQAGPCLLRTVAILV